jgi:arylsulfatase A-like enzyme
MIRCTAKHRDCGRTGLAGALQAGGYSTIHLVKWHVGKDPLTQGFDINIGGAGSH